MHSAYITAQKMKFSIKDFFSKCNQIPRKLRIWSQLLKNTLMENSSFSYEFMCQQFGHTWIHWSDHHCKRQTISGGNFFCLNNSCTQKVKMHAIVPYLVYIRLKWIGQYIWQTVHADFAKCARNASKKNGHIWAHATKND